jgi:hypothetical protein
MSSVDDAPLAPSRASSYGLSLDRIEAPVDIETSKSIT